MSTYILMQFETKKRIGLKITEETKIGKNCGRGGGKNLVRGGKRGLEAFSIEPDIGKGKGINEPINYGGSRHNTGGILPHS